MGYKSKSIFYLWGFARYSLGDKELCVVLVFWTLLVLYFLYRVAEGSFVPCLVFVSDILRLNPEASGLIVLSLGNNIVDLLTVFFTSEEHPHMVLGYALGTGIFALSMMLGAIILCALVSSRVNKKKEGILQRVIKLDRNVAIKNIFGMVFCGGFLGILMFLERATVFVCAIGPALWVVYFLFSLFGLQKKEREDSAATEKIPFFFVACANKELFREMSLREAFFLVWGFVDVLLGLPMAPWTERGFYNKEGDERAERGRRLFLRAEKIRFFVSAPIICFISSFFCCRRQLTDEVLVAVFSACFFFTAALWILFSCLFWNREIPRMQPVLAAYTFYACLVYIYILIQEFVLCLGFMGDFMGIDDSYIGLTVLCFGNVFCDFLTNILITRRERDGVRATIPGAFSGQIQAILLASGLGFFIGCINAENKTIEIGVLGKEIWFSFWAFWGLLLLFGGTCFLTKFRLKLVHGIVLCVLYCVYFGCILACGVLAKTE
ncbi:MAG: sodium calcium exchanger [Amphiamblys sp. WSBS2006]|nr:MAG: sodium calcium exchanger [Amphiamblys sp. WSBS2006]